VLELSKPIKNIYTSTFQQCIPSTSTTLSTLQCSAKQRDEKVKFLLGKTNKRLKSPLERKRS